MRLYNLENKSISELKTLIEKVKGHLILTVPEKEMNIKLINEKLDKYDNLLREIEDGKADPADIF